MDMVGEWIILLFATSQKYDQAFCTPYLIVALE